MSDDRDEGGGGQPDQPPDKRPQRGYEQPPELDDEDEAALDRAWEKIRREDEERRQREKPGDDAEPAEDA